MIKEWVLNINYALYKPIFMIVIKRNIRIFTLLQWNGKMPLNLNFRYISTIGPRQISNVFWIQRSGAKFWSFHLRKNYSFNDTGVNSDAEPAGTSCKRKTDIRQLMADQSSARRIAPRFNLSLRNFGTDLKMTYSPGPNTLFGCLNKLQFFGLNTF